MLALFLERIGRAQQRIPVAVRQHIRHNRRAVCDGAGFIERHNLHIAGLLQRFGILE